MNSIKNIMSQILKEKLSAFNDDNDLKKKYYFVLTYRGLKQSYIFTIYSKKQPLIIN